MNGPHHRRTTYSALKLLAAANGGRYSINGTTLVSSSKCLEEQGEIQDDKDSKGYSKLEKEEE